MLLLYCLLTAVLVPISAISWFSYVLIVLPYTLEVFLICYSLRKARQLAKNCGVQIEKKMMALHASLLLAVVLNVIFCNILLSGHFESSFDLTNVLSWIGMVLDFLV